MNDREKSRQRVERLKRLRDERKETVARVQAAVKEQNAIRQQICRSMREAPKTVPEVAEATGLPADLVLWHITAMKKYGQAVEVSSCGDYFTYQLIRESDT